MGVNRLEPGAAADSPEQKVLEKIRGDMWALLAQGPELPPTSLARTVQTVAERAGR